MANTLGLPTIQFDNPQRIYKPGDSVTGWIQITSDVDLHRVTIQWFGEAAIDFGPAPGRGPPFGQQQQQARMAQLANNNIVYFNQENVLFDTEDDRDARPGREFDFKFDLPYDLPSSYEGEFGRIRYVCYARVNRGGHRGAAEETSECKFFIDNPPDLKSFDEDPVNLAADANLGNCCCKSGIVLMQMYIAKQVFKRSEMIFIDLKMNNESDHDLPGPEAILRQVVTYNGEGQGQRTQQFVVARAVEPRQVNDETTRNIQMSVQIPSTAVPTINNCKLISIQYELYVHCGGNKLEMLCPLVIG